MERQRIAVEISDGVAHVILARPDKLNAMDEDMFAAIGAGFRELGTDPRVRAILLTGRGPHFSAGLDLHYAASQLGSHADPARAAEARLRHIQWLQDAFSAVEQARAPVIAAINGGCIGAGVDLVSACDLRLCSADAFFRVAEVDVGITADLGTLQRLTHLMPGGLVRELVYTGRKLEAAEAARHGFVNQVHRDPEALVAAGIEMAQAIASKSPLAIAGAKMSLNYSRGRPAEDGLRQVALWNAATLAGEDLEKALRARQSKEEPSFDPLDP